MEKYRKSFNSFWIFCQWINKTLVKYLENTAKNREYQQKKKKYNDLFLMFTTIKKY